MGRIPQEFLDKMKKLLGSQYGAFLASYDQPRQYGLRVNTGKISVEEFERLAPFHLKKIPWVENGYFYEEQDAPARHPFYYAGLYYLQEPSAMTPASVLPVHPGDRVLDLCAAPGGKATELGAKLRGEGLLVANDISASRAKALLKNIEVFGISNAFVTNEVPAKLAEQFPEFFDKILVDAPCSGEGMFRKDPAAAGAWDVKKPSACAKQQKEIIFRAAQMLAPGGLLLYSTCTFSPEENEQVIAYLLDKRDDMELLEIPQYEGFSPGIPAAARADWMEADDGLMEADALVALAEKKWAAEGRFTNQHGEEPDLAEDRYAELKKCVRIFPHKMQGEGHFLALLHRKKPADGEMTHGEAGLMAERRAAAGEMAERWALHGKTAHGEAGLTAERRSGRQKTLQNSTRTKAASAEKAELQVLMDFLRDVSMPMDVSRLEVRKGQAYYVPEATRENRGLVFLRNGLYLGEVKKDRFEPSQSFAMALKGTEYDAVISLDYRDERVIRYLKGETIDVDDIAKSGGRGWRLVCVNGYPLGWGKLAGGVLKNKYHFGWRMKY